MATRHKPYWGYRGRYLLSTDDIRVYSDDAIEELAARYDITEAEQKKAMAGRLEGAAQVYRVWKNNYDDAPRRPNIKAAIDHVEEHATKLADALANMDDVTESLFWRPEMEVENLLFDESATESRFGHTISRIETSEGGTALVYQGPREIYEALTILKNYSAEARKDIPHDTGGPTPGEAMRMWAVNIRNLFTEVLGRDFTLDYDKGIPVSKAARFCVDAFRFVDPTVPPSRIIGAMKKAIRTGSNRNAGKNTPKK